MSYEFEIDPKELFHERYPQMIRSLPAEDVDLVRANVTRMWVNEPNGWIYEWSMLAERHAKEGRHDLATLAHGWAKFPIIANDAGRAALRHQIEAYELWSKDFPVDHTRRVVNVPIAETTTPVAIHFLSPRGTAADTPIMLASGGVDAWKMDLHSVFQAFAQHAGVRVLAFDIPGTGESRIPLSRESTQIVTGLAAEARRLGARKIGHLGISMGGYFSAHSGLAQEVDAAIVLGGPVQFAFEPGRLTSFGMSDIVGNAMGFNRSPHPPELSEALSRLSLQPLLEQQTNAPMLVINGADDVHIPQQDTLIFEGRADTEVQLLSGTGHCAVTRLDEVIPKMIGWMAQHLR